MGLFDNDGGLFGYNPSDADKQQALYQGLLGLGAQLSASGAPTLTPGGNNHHMANAGNAFNQGMQGYLNHQKMGHQQKQQSQMQNIMAGLEMKKHQAAMADAERKRAAQATFRDTLPEGHRSMFDAAPGQYMQSAFNSMKPPTPTDDMREYSMAKGQGFGGSFQDWMVGNRKAGATSVNVNTGADDKKFNEAMGTSRAKFVDQLYVNRDASLGRLGNIQSLMGLVDKIPSGAGAETLLEAKKYAAQFGFEVDEAGLANAEAFRAKAFDFVMDRVSETKGSVSNAEMNLFALAGPSLMNTPEGNRMILKTMQQITQRDIAVADYLAEYLEQNPNATRHTLERIKTEKRRELSAQPLFNEQQKAYLSGMSPFAQQQGGQFPVFNGAQPQDGPAPQGSFRIGEDGIKEWVPGDGLNEFKNDGGLTVR